MRACPEICQAKTERSLVRPIDSEVRNYMMRVLLISIGLIRLHPEEILPGKEVGFFQRLALNFRP